MHHQISQATLTHSHQGLVKKQIPFKSTYSNYRLLLQSENCSLLKRIFDVEYRIDALALRPCAAVLCLTLPHCLVAVPVLRPTPAPTVSVATAKHTAAAFKRKEKQPMPSRDANRSSAPRPRVSGTHRSPKPSLSKTRNPEFIVQKDREIINQENAS